MDKIKGYFNLCRKANYLIIGADNLKYYDKKLYLIVINKNPSNNILKTANKLADNYKIPVIMVNNSVEYLIDISNCQIVAIKNKGLTDCILKLTEEFEYFRRGE